MCGYSMQHLESAEHRDTLGLICGMHGYAIPRG
jgi:hypothetical protein